MSKRIDTAALIDAAKAATGLDFTTRDFVEPLERFAESIDAEGNLGEAGIEGFRQDASRILTNRLLIDAAFAANPEIAEQDVSDPVIITGLPRTGSTKLQKVLAAAGQRYQSLPLWRALFPAPIAPPGTDPDPRITLTEQQTAVMFEMFPDFMAAHPMSTHEPEEEMLLLQLSFRIPTNGWFYRAPSYVDWTERQDLTPTYTDLRRALQLLQWQDAERGLPSEHRNERGLPSEHRDGRRDRPWVLKSPAHLGCLTPLFEAFPQATVAHCHRDIHEALPSLARLLELIQLSRGAEQVDKHELGAFLTGYCAELWRRNLEQRAGLDPDRILDLRYRDIRDDIGPVLDQIHTSRGVALDNTTRATMLAWEDTNPQHRHGTHVYSLDRYGLTREGLDEAFADYLARFGS